MNLNVRAQNYSLSGHLLLKKHEVFHSFNCFVCFSIRNAGGDCSSPHRHHCRGCMEDLIKRTFLKRRRYIYRLLEKPSLR